MRSDPLTTVRDRARPHQFLSGSVRSMAGQDDDRSSGCDLSDSPHRVQATTLGHPHIDECRIGPTGPDELDRLLAVTSHADNLELAAERPAQHQLNHGVIVCNHQPCGAAAGESPWFLVHLRGMRHLNNRVAISSACPLPSSRHGRRTNHLVSGTRQRCLRIGRQTAAVDRINEKHARRALLCSSTACSSRPCIGSMGCHL